MKACTPETVKPTHSVNDEGWGGVGLQEHMHAQGSQGVAKDDSPVEPEPWKTD